MTTQIAFGYVRISTTEQAHGYGLDVQESRIREYAQRKGLPAIQLFSESKSGESIIQRHEFNTMMSAAESKVEEGLQVHVIFSSLDRLSRRLFDQETIVMRCFTSGVRLHSTQEAENDTLDPEHSDDPMRTVIRQFFGVFHQFDKAIIQRRMDGGLQAKGARGGFTGGRPPFGYKASEQELVIDEGRASVIRLLFALHKEGVPNTTIAALLRQRYPVLCRSFAHQHVTRLLGREALYRKGEYVPRHADGKVTVRPDLIILTDNQDRATLEGIGQVTLDWAHCPPRLRLDIAAHLLGASIARIRELIAIKHLQVQHEGEGVYLPRDTILNLHTLLGDAHVAA